ncbi:MAG TPA: hypothetical protein VFI40_03860 [Nocardioides sp.]|nr:hypothetical protein [Nocardioides sp.]
MSETPFRPMLRTQADVEAMWRRLMKPLGFGSCSLWLVVIEGERPVPKVMEFAEMPAAPEDGDAEALGVVLEELAEPDTRFAFLRSRPGAGRPNADDRAWANALYAAGHRAGARLEVIHLAHDHDIVPMTVDDLMAEPA